ncbi:alpha-glucuronidase family glycosyl hydrolase [Sphingomonas sp. Leaf22]|uniref:alpha-glucuronidase family glycosyl hydrolase n=1 Tax=Sphingomonas sp. Leaf22 TaxID=1735687 RepID=UPI001F35756A|nr:alpha-glucuronidase family glycosyl hydrolase [Sphingomonas sp. Leaf22]
MQSIGREGFVLRSVAINGKRTTVVAANRSIGVLYGAFRLLRIAQMTGSLTDVSVTDRPKLGMRLFNHRDNLDR